MQLNVDIEPTFRFRYMRYYRQTERPALDSTPTLFRKTRKTIQKTRNTRKPRILEKPVIPGNQIPENPENMYARTGLSQGCPCPDRPRSAHGAPYRSIPYRISPRTVVARTSVLWLLYSSLVTLVSVWRVGVEIHSAWLKLKLNLPLGWSNQIFSPYAKYLLECFGILPMDRYWENWIIWGGGDAHNGHNPSHGFASWSSGGKMGFLGLKTFSYHTETTEKQSWLPMGQSSGKMLTKTWRFG